MSGTGMPGNSRFKIFGNRVAKSRELPGSGGNYSGLGIPRHITNADSLDIFYIFIFVSLKVGFSLKSK